MLGPQVWGLTVLLAAPLGPDRYRLVEHRRYVDALLETLGVRENVTFVEVSAAHVDAIMEALKGVKIAGRVIQPRLAHADGDKRERSSQGPQDGRPPRGPRGPGGPGGPHKGGPQKSGYRKGGYGKSGPHKGGPRKGGPYKKRPYKKGPPKGGSTSMGPGTPPQRDKGR